MTDRRSLLVFCLLGGLGHAAFSQSTSDARAACRIGGLTLDVVLTSAPRDQSDTTLAFVDERREPAVATFAGYAGQLSFLSLPKNWTSACDKVDALDDGRGNLVVLLRATTPPAGDVIAAALVRPSNASRPCVVGSSWKSQRDVPDGTVARRLRLRGVALTSGGSDNCDIARMGQAPGTCGEFRGHKIVRRTDEWILPWWQVTWMAGGQGWQKTLDVSRTTVSTFIKGYFESERAFQQAFGLRSTGLETYWFKRLTLVNGERWLCIAPDRRVPSSDRLCRPLPPALPVSPDVTPDDVAVYKAVIDYKIRPEAERLGPKERPPGPMPLLVHDRTLARCGPDGPLVKGMGCLLERASTDLLDFTGALIPRWRDELARMLRERNAVQVAFPVSRLEGVIAVAPDEGYDVARREQQRTRGFASFSLPAYRNADQAVVYAGYHCGGMCGSTWFFLLQRTAGQWRVLAEQLVSVS